MPRIHALVWRSGITTTTDFRIIFITASARTACSATRARARSLTSRTQRADPRRFQHVRDVARLRSGRPARSVRLQLRQVVARNGRLLQPDGKQKSYCTPEAYRGTTCWLYRNLGNGKFEDVTAKSGIFDSSSKSLGVTMLDFDNDGWPDMFVANDTQPNKLYRNLRNGRFEEVGVRAGVAFSDDGKARAGMGVDVADLDDSGFPTLVGDELSERDDGTVPGVGQRLLQRHRAGLGGWPNHAPQSWIRLLLLRCRPGRHARTAGCERAHRQHDPRYGVRAGSAPVPESRRQVSRRGSRRLDRICAPAMWVAERHSATSTMTATLMCS